MTKINGRTLCSKVGPHEDPNEIFGCHFFQVPIFSISGLRMRNVRNDDINLGECRTQLEYRISVKSAVLSFIIVSLKIF